MEAPKIVNVNTLSKEEKERIWEYLEILGQKFIKVHNELGCNFSEGKHRDCLENLLNGESGNLLLLISNGIPIGYCFCQCFGNIGRINELYVLPKEEIDEKDELSKQMQDAREAFKTSKSGSLGSRLLEGAESYLKSSGAEFLRLHVDYRNSHARKFYERMGYKLKLKKDNIMNRFIRKISRNDSIRKMLRRMNVEKFSYIISSDLKDCRDRTRCRHNAEKILK